MQNRGYDSAGICTIDSNLHELIMTKFASQSDYNAIELLKQYQSRHGPNTIGIGHTRWATHGAINNANAHPHLDSQSRIAVVHNGIIENFQELKNFLEDKGYSFQSETDTEVVTNLIAYNLDLGYSLFKAITASIKKLQGTWGLVIFCKDDPDHLFLCKNGSPLLIGYDKTFAIIASEASAFLNCIKKYTVLNDHEILIVGRHPDSGNIYFSHDYETILEPNYLNFENLSTEIYHFYQEKDSDQETNQVGEAPMIALTPSPYSHWMLKEIMEQPTSLMRTLNLGGRLLNDYQVHLGGLRNHTEDLLKIRHLLILGCGTSYHAALLGAKYFKRLQCFDTVHVIDASEFSIHDLPLSSSK